MIRKAALLAFQEDLRNGMSIAEACTKHNISFKYAFQNAPQLEKRKRRKKHEITKGTGEQYIRERKGRYFIRKTVRGKMKMFGTYYSLEDAIKVREHCKKHGWKRTYIDRYCEELGVNRCKSSRDRVRYN